MIIPIVITTVISLEATLGFRWLEHNSHYDFVVGIAVHENPISIGVFISKRTIVTSANPLNQYLKNVTSITIHTVSQIFNHYTTRRVQSVAGNQSLRKKAWIIVGFDRTHTTIHDLALVNVVEDDKIGEKGGVAGRKPYAIKLPESNSSIFNQGWIFAGFEYTDEEHIEENFVLDITYTDNTLVVCDEWMPREWGLFLCLRNDERLEVASGAPLFTHYDWRTIVGIGSFTLRKGKESVLVFTDVRPYVNKLYGYLKDEEDTSPATVP